MRRPPIEVFVINAEEYGSGGDFPTLEQAQATIRRCGEEFKRVSLYHKGDRIYNEQGNIVGEVIKVN